MVPIIRIGMECSAFWMDIVQGAEHHATSQGEVLITLSRKYRVSIRIKWSTIPLMISREPVSK
jgi:hypothetical protein